MTDRTLAKALGGVGILTASQATVHRPPEYEHVRFFGGRTCDYDGSFWKRICELKRAEGAVKFYVYG